MAKYDPLYHTLISSKQITVVLTFEEISKLVHGLPASAYQFSWWWKNAERKSFSHVQSEAWRSAGYRVIPDMTARSVTSQRIAKSNISLWDAPIASNKKQRHPERQS